MDNNRTTFKALSIGDVFRFASEVDMPFSGMERGPWIKATSRRYMKADLDAKPMVCTIGTNKAEVIRDR